MLREIEAALLKWSAVSSDQVGRKVTVSLSYSRTDPTAVGCTRSWQCVCAGTCARACPFCASVRQADSLRTACASSESPFFPDTVGRVLTKSSIVSAFESLAGCI
eukprot:342205-Amphidinium_carterae.1